MGPKKRFERGAPGDPARAAQVGEEAFARYKLPVQVLLRSMHGDVAQPDGVTESPRDVRVCAFSSRRPFPCRVQRECGQSLVVKCKGSAANPSHCQVYRCKRKQRVTSGIEPGSEHAGHVEVGEVLEVFEEKADKSGAMLGC